MAGGELNSHSGSVNLESSPVKKLRYEGQGSMTHVTMGCVDAERFVCMPDPGTVYRLQTALRGHVPGEARRRVGAAAAVFLAFLDEEAEVDATLAADAALLQDSGQYNFLWGTFWWRRVRIPCGA